MQVIITKYLRGRGSIRARAEAGNIAITYDPSMSSEDNHRAAAIALCEMVRDHFKRRHPGAHERFWNPANLAGGPLPGGGGWAWLVVGG